MAFLCPLCPRLLIFHFQIWHISLGVEDSHCPGADPGRGVGWEEQSQSGVDPWLPGDTSLLLPPPLPILFLPSPASSLLFPLFLQQPLSSAQLLNSSGTPSGLHGFTYLHQPSPCPF